MEGIIQQYIGYDGKSAFDFALGDEDVMGVYMMSFGDPSNLLPFDTNKGLANKGIGLPNYKQPEQKINITTGLSKPKNYSVPEFTTHQLGSTSYDNLPIPQKHIPNIHKAKYNPDTEEVEHRTPAKKSSQKSSQKSSKKIAKKSISSSLKNEINSYLDGKKSKIKHKKNHPKKTKQNKNNGKKYRIGNATITRTSKHKSKRDRVQQFIKKHS